MEGRGSKLDVTGRKKFLRKEKLECIWVYVIINAYQR